MEIGPPSRRLTRRRVLTLGAACVASAAAVRRAGAAPSPAAAVPGPSGASPAPGASPAGAASDQMLLVARRDVSPAGRRVRAVVANQVFPSFELRDRAGETLALTVENQLEEPTCVHAHGLVVPNAMDGVPGVTQAPIEPRQSFRYLLPLPEPGTFFYESTWKLQRQLGLVGPLVIAARDEPHASDQDLVLLLTDWTNDDPAQIVPRLRAGRGGPGSEGDPGRPVNPLPDGKPFPIDVRYDTYLLNGRSHRDAWKAEARPGERLRLRLINGSAATFFRFMVEGHALRVIAADGRPIQPVEVDDLILATGERYDVLVTMGEPGSYTVRAAALGASGGAVGVLYGPGVRPVVGTRPPVWGKRQLGYAQLRAAEEAAPARGEPRKVRVVLGGDRERYLWSVDGRSYPGMFVAGDGATDEPLVLERGERVQLEIANRTALWQPMHLHGYRFRLLASPAAGRRAPLKDTVAVPPQGSVRIELVTDHPGRWLLRSCHLYRGQSGLARVVAV